MKPSFTKRVPATLTPFTAAIAVWLAGACAAAVAPAAFAQPSPQGAGAPSAALAAVRETMSNGFIVKFREGARSEAEIEATMQGLRSLAQARGVAIASQRTLATGARVLKLPRHAPARVLDAVLQEMKLYDGAIEYVDPNYVNTINYTPNDPLLYQQWGLIDPVAGVRAQKAWDMSKGSNVRIAIVDTGVIAHADLAANLLPGYDFITEVDRARDGNGRDSNPTDPGDWFTSGQCDDKPARDSVWHGTHVAGIAAGSGNNGQGIAGVAPQAKIVPVRVLGRCGADTADSIDAWMWAAGFAVPDVPANANPARVINYSAGSRRACTSSEQEAINRITNDKGVTVVVSAGNDNLNVSGQAPANCAGVIAVGATGKTGARAWYSNFGSGITVSAPGGDFTLSTPTDTDTGIASTYNTGATTPLMDTFAQLQGTSMAAPHVAGVVALMTSSNGALTDGATKTLLRESVNPFSTAWAGGTGIIDAEKAVNAARAYRVEVEPNDTLANAQLVLNSPSDHWALLTKSGDVDHFLTSVPPQASLKIELVNTSNADLRMTLLDQTGKVMYTKNSNGPGKGETITRPNSFSTSEPIYVKVDVVPGTPVSIFGTPYRLKLTRGPLY